jgi:hypothetical protein
MSKFAGLSRDNCAAACSVHGCVIGGISRCAHPTKGGLPLELLNDPAMQEEFDAACVAIGVRNVYKAGENTP